jgi:hypothetical protein
MSQHHDDRAYTNGLNDDEDRLTTRRVGAAALVERTTGAWLHMAAVLVGLGGVEGVEEMGKALRAYTLYHSHYKSTDTDVGHLRTLRQ